MISLTYVAYSELVILFFLLDSEVIWIESNKNKHDHSYKMHKIFKEKCANDKSLDL